MTSFILLLLPIYFLGITTLLAWLSDLSKEKTEKFPSWQAAIAGDLNNCKREITRQSKTDISR